MAATEVGEHFERRIDRLVKGRRFATRADVLREGLRLLEQQESKHTGLEALRDLIREGDESGEAEAFDIATIRADAKAERRRKTS